MTSAHFDITGQGADEALVLTGDWTAAGLGRVYEQLPSALAGHDLRRVDVSGLGRLDTAGAYALLRALPGALSESAFSDRPDVVQLLGIVRQSGALAPAPRKPRAWWGDFFVSIGATVSSMGKEMFAQLSFVGHLTLTAPPALLGLRKTRWAAWTAQAEQAGLGAVPIVTLANFFIGAVVAFITADALRKFGASVFAVQLIGVAALREFAPIITAVLLAGRSASAFAAEIGAMRMNQEVDAMTIMGIDPFDGLVIPRFAALVVMTPLLVFIGMVAAMIGGALVLWGALDLSPIFFVEQISQTVDIRQFWVGMAKAPVFAAVVAAIGCHQGLSVGGDVEQLGRRVTAAVVQAIFAIIALDAVFALVFMELHV